MPYECATRLWFFGQPSCFAAKNAQVAVIVSRVLNEQRLSLQRSPRLAYCLRGFFCLGGWPKALKSTRDEGSHVLRARVRWPCREQACHGCPWLVIGA